MTTNVDVWVPDTEAAPRVRHALRSVSGISLRTSLPEHAAWTFLVVFIDRLGADWWTNGEDRIRWTWESAQHPVCPVFIGSFGVGKSHAAALQQLATLSAWAGRKRIEPFVAPDDAAFRRLVLARKAGAEKRLIAAANVEGRKLSVWSCEPRQYVVDASDIPSLATMTDEELQRFTLSSSGSRLHWDDGDVDLNMATILEIADPNVRKEHEDELRKELKAYAAAIKSLREERGISQAAIEGLSDRQVRRLEQGLSTPHAASLEKLATAHGMSIENYLSELSKRMHTPRSKRVGRQRGRKG